MIRPILEDLLYVPFVDRGRDMYGLDCWGAAKEIFSRYGIQVPDYPFCCHDTRSIGRTIYDHWGKDWVKISEPEEPCLVVMSTDPRFPKFANHLGVYVGDGDMIHTIEKQGMHRDKLVHPYWKNTIQGYFRYAPTQP